MRQLALLLLLFAPLVTRADDLSAARGVIERLLPQQAGQFELVLTPSDGPERYRISAENGHIRVEGNTISAILFGVNWSLKHPGMPIEGETPYPHRYALNENVDGYTAPYWDWPRWQHEIDGLALAGINEMLIERGTDSVLYETFREFGYTDTEIRAWITQPAHQNWQLMGNLCCFDGPIGKALLDKRAQSARQIVARLRELGITPVLPGFYGIVPADFDKKFPAAHVVPQGDWAGFTRPGWLDPRDPLFAKLAESFYRHQRELFGDSTIYDMEVFQEGGDSGDVNVPEAARAVQTALEAAHPGAAWMMLAWQGNPRQDLLSGVDRNRLLIIDIDHDRIPHDDRATDFQNAPYLYGGLWEFGGRTTLGGALGTIAQRLPRMAKANPNMAGTAIFTEGMDTNPFAFDLFTELAWGSEPLDLADWTKDYVRHRYGAADPHALAAWDILRRTAYDQKIDETNFNSERDAAAESLFDAQPSFAAVKASNWSPEGLRYDPVLFARALPELLAVAPELRHSEAYRYDLVDVARQTLANEARRLLPEIKNHRTLARRWLTMMDMQDRLLSTDPHFLLGSWLAPVKGWASSPEEAKRLDHDARSILTTWGERKASDEGPLHDYGNKDWAGLTRDYYRKRWELFFKDPAKPIDWYRFGEDWNRSGKVYSDRPSGDPYAAAKAIEDFLSGRSAQGL